MYFRRLRSTALSRTCRCWNND